MASLSRTVREFGSDGQAARERYQFLAQQLSNLIDESKRKKQEELDRVATPPTFGQFRKKYE